MQETPIRAILFDLGDTLIDFKPLEIGKIVKVGAADSYQKIAEMGYRLPSLGAYRRRHMMAVRLALVFTHLMRREFNILTLMRRRTARLGVPDTDDIMLDLGWRWYRPTVAYSSIEPDLIATLRTLRDAGFKLGVVSNTFMGGVLLDRHMEEMGILEFFPMRIYSSEFGVRKPDPRIFQEALKQIDEPAESTLFVGDIIKNDIIGAGRLGMKTAWKIRSKTAGTHRNAPPPPKVIPADYTIKRIADLLPILMPKRIEEPVGASVG
jgi:HAD superfamily hydrolase (TIGR01549 family)